MHVLQGTKGRIVVEPPGRIVAEFFEPLIVTWRSAFELMKSRAKHALFEVAHDFKFDESG